MRMIVDMSSLLWQSLRTGESAEFGKKVEFDGRMVTVNGWQHGYECAVNHMVSVMDQIGIAPTEVIFVVEGQYSKARRKSIYSGYKEGRESRPPEAYIEFELCRDQLLRAFKDVGSQVCRQDGCEGDDVIAYLAKKLDGDLVILTRDGDMTTLINKRVSLWQNDHLTKENKYGPFPCNFTPVYKALVGDGNEYKGAKGFGPKMFLDFLVWAGDPGLAAIEGMMQRRTLHELEEDVAEFKPLRKIIDSAEHVYQSYECALLHDEWVNTPRQPLVIEQGVVQGLDVVTDPRLAQWATGAGAVDCDWYEMINPTKPKVVKQHAVFDCELIGSENPVFLVCVEIIESGEKFSFWWHKEGDMERMHQMLQREDLTWVSFNGIHFDAPLMSAAIGGKDPLVLKRMANAIINEDGKSWQMPSMFNFDPVIFDHLDLIEVSPGVRVSLKTFAGRMGYPSMIDLPFHHDLDLNAEQMEVLETYCQNDLGVTKALFNRLRSEIDLRAEMSEEHGIDLRSKSDAQVAEAVLKKAANIKGRSSETPSFVLYKAPDFIESDSDVINDIIDQLHKTKFKINQANGQVETPDFLKDPVALCSGTYQMGVGGLHSTHDKRLHVVATDEMLISDFDVASYYPNIMLKAGLTPRVEGGARFIEEYRKIYDRRIEAKRSGDKKVANALKIALNGTFGKLGSPYSAFYSPDLMLAVTLTGQLNLMCLIYDLECHPEIRVLSANTDGIAVHYPARLRSKVLNAVLDNAKRTGFEYEETRYAKIAMKDVNNYLAVTTDAPAAALISAEEGVVVKGGKVDVKRKGLYASTGLMKNPTNEVCSNMAVDFLKSWVHPTEAIKAYADIKDFVAIRNVKGGGIQYDSFEEVDDWVCVNDLGTKDNEWRRPCWEEDKVVKRKSRPAPVQVGVGGQYFGRIARWYMQKGGTMPINYAGSGNKVPKTDGARLCMMLPDELPSDIDLDWYVQETIDMLADMGVELDGPEETLQEPTQNIDKTPVTV